MNTFQMICVVLILLAVLLAAAKFIFGGYQVPCAHCDQERMRVAADYEAKHSVPCVDSESDIDED